MDLVSRVLDLDVREDFPALQASDINGHRLVYLDSAATALKAAPVIDRMQDYYRRSGVTVHRSVHTLASEATEAYEGARANVARFLGAEDPSSIVFTRGTTESLNLVARGYAETQLGPDDEIVVTAVEHHSNLIPWQRVARVTGARLVFPELTPEGEFTPDALRAVLSPRTRLLTVTAASNVLGTVNPVKELARLAHEAGAVVVVDAAQWVPHHPTAVAEWDADFVALSAHKMTGPTGVGVLYGKPRRLLDTEPLMLGGEMIDRVGLRESSWAEVPARFEGGTPNVAGVIGLDAAVDYLRGIGLERIGAHDDALAQQAYHKLAALPGVTVYGPESPRTALVAFNVDGVHPHDVAQVLDARGIAIRAGHHCAQPLMDWLQVGSTCRASFYLYNGDDDVDALVAGIGEVKRYFHHGS